MLRKLADRLGEDDYPWEDMQLILRQFDFRTSDVNDWQDSKRSYVLWHIEDGSDERLIELDEYLFGNSSPSAVDLVDLPWEPGTFRLFISHSSKQAGLANKMRELFLRWRIDAFVAHTTVEPTREWERVIEAALSTCHASAALITTDFQTSKWCDQEIGYCLARRIPIVPVKLAGVDPHGFIAKYQAVTTPHDAPPIGVANAVFAALCRNVAVRTMMAVPVVSRFTSSASFDSARSNFKLIADMYADVWTRELVDLVERSCAGPAPSDSTNRYGPTLAFASAVAPSSAERDCFVSSRALVSAARGDA